MSRKRKPPFKAEDFTVPQDGSLGEMFETEMFGRRFRRTDWFLREMLHLGLLQVKIFRRAQGWDPLRPQGQMGLNLFNAVKRYLPEKLRPHLRYYPAVGMPLDMLGVDAFFTLPFHRAVTIDFTILHPSDRFWERKKKALTDVLVSRHDIIDSRKIELVGRDIASCFRKPLVIEVLYPSKPVPDKDLGKGIPESQNMRVFLARRALGLIDD